MTKKSRYVDSDFQHFARTKGVFLHATHAQNAIEKTPGLLSANIRNNGESTDVRDELRRLLSESLYEIQQALLALDYEEEDDTESIRYGSPEFTAAAEAVAETCKTVEMTLRTKGADR